MGINHDKLVLDWTKKVSSLAGKTEKGTDSDGKHTSADREEEKGEDSTSNDKNEKGTDPYGKHSSEQPADEKEEKGEGSMSSDKNEESAKSTDPDGKHSSEQPADGKEEKGEGSTSNDKNEKGTKSTDPDGKHTSEQPADEKEEKGEGSMSSDKNEGSAKSTDPDGKHSSEQPADRKEEKGEGSTSNDKSSNDDCVPGTDKECGLPTDHTVAIIGDNWDTNIKPRDMRSNNQVKSLHLFHTVATVSRVKTLHLDDEQSIGSVRSLPISDFLPSIDDCTAIRDNYVILVARVITKNFKHFSFLRDCVPKHIHHEYIAQMAQKTTMVSVTLYFNYFL